MEKKALTTQEIFCGMPHSLHYFNGMDKKIKTFTPQKRHLRSNQRIEEKKA